jgi:hypothetical protein
MQQIQKLHACELTNLFFSKYCPANLLKWDNAGDVV